jgi:nucleoside phosphorylase
MIKYKEIDFEELNLHNNNVILIVTATMLETRCLHEVFDFYDNSDAIIKIHNSKYTYYVGVFGKYLSIHVQCGTMGSISKESSITTVSEAITLFKPKVTLMIGIAFGVDDKEQRIGDVLVSECITPYNFKKVQNSGEEIIRANDAPASSLLLNKFKNSLNWEYLLDDKSKATVIHAPILSGEELINDITRRNSLLKEKPTAKGGEMEGAGLYSAADGKSEWILVKGICDFADGNKDKNKEKNQIIAMKSAISICIEVFSSLSSFNSIDLLPIKNEVGIIPIDNPHKINQVLFDRYDISKMKFYLERDIDYLFSSNLKLYSLWIFGKSGRGKSNIVLRNIIDKNLTYIMVSLANCVGLSVDDFFKEIFIELSEKLEPQNSNFQNSNFQNSIKDIISLLERHYNNKEVYIIIDEIPLGNDENCRVFTEKICSLFISNSMYSNCSQIKYILSSIYSPLNHIPEFNQKIHEIVKFIEIKDWEKTESTSLVNIIQEELKFCIEDDIKDEIVSTSYGSPRFIKKTFKNSFALGGLNINNYKTVLLETQRELKNN